jgi:hypothetical protein
MTFDFYKACLGKKIKGDEFYDNYAGKEKNALAFIFAPSSNRCKKTLSSS